MNAGLRGSGADPARLKVSVEKAGRTVEEAVAAALVEMGLPRQEVEVEVLDEGSRGILGMGAREARVRVRRRGAGDGPGPAVREVAVEIIRLMGFEAVVTTSAESGVVRVAVDGDELAGLIGKHGQTLAAVEILVAAVAARRLGMPVRIEMDVLGYRERRIASLEALARRTAERVARMRREVSLSPMNSRDRRVIHLALQDHPAVITASRGEGGLRRVVVMPRGSGDSLQGGNAREEGRQADGAARRGREESSSQRPQGVGPVPGRGNELASRGNNLRVKGYFRRRTPGARRGRSQLAEGNSMNVWRSPGKKPFGQRSGGTPARPEGLPVDEELEAEIQAHLERIERSRSAHRDSRTAPLDRDADLGERPDSTTLEGWATPADPREPGDSRRPAAE
ncbi:MAG: RNA-binding cell elongation regulator Jag/EloR [Armatimonadota bacterium]|nr:RNA-binding cell elongation regulator Jag/EloR [Armatimonadota bacterium]